MDRKLQESKKTDERNIGLQRKDSQEIRQSETGKKAKPGCRQQQKPQKITDAHQLKITVEHLFGDNLNKWIDEINDPRRKDQRVYELKHLFWLGLMMFILRLGSRLQLTAQKDTPSFGITCLIFQERTKSLWLTQIQ